MNPIFIFGFVGGYSLGLLAGTGALSFNYCCKKKYKEVPLKSFSEMRSQCGNELTHVFAEPVLSETPWDHFDAADEHAEEEAEDAEAKEAEAEEDSQESEAEEAESEKAEAEETNTKEATKSELTEDLKEPACAAEDLYTNLNSAN